MPGEPDDKRKRPEPPAQWRPGLDGDDDASRDDAWAGDGDGPEWMGPPPWVWALLGFVFNVFALVLVMLACMNKSDAERRGAARACLYGIAAGFLLEGLLLLVLTTSGSSDALLQLYNLGTGAPAAGSGKAF